MVAEINPKSSTVRCGGETEGMAWRFLNEIGRHYAAAKDCRVHIVSGDKKYYNASERPLT